MTDAANATNVRFPRDRSGPALVLLLGLHVVICCISLTFVAWLYASHTIVTFDSARIVPAALIAAPFSLVAILFVLSRFSFGWFVGFNFYTIPLGYLWLVEFSVFPYDHRWPAISAAFAGL